MLLNTKKLDLFDLFDLCKKMADRTGLEPATSGVTGRHSNQLNYRSAYTDNNLMVGGTGVEPVTYGL